MSRKSKRENKKGNIGFKIFIIIVVMIIIALASILGYKIIKDKPLGLKPTLSQPVEEIATPTPVIEEKKVQIFSGEDRPIAVMLDNNKDAWPHASLNEAYLVYEIIVEGNETRLMALFKGKDLEEIGPVRSARHYFLDYALENDAIYTHFGWSPQAESDIKSLDVDNVNGINYDSGRNKTDSSLFWRTNTKYAPHNAMVSTSSILQIADELGYRTTSTEESVLNYVTDEVELVSDTVATDIVIPYASSNKVEYEYDEETKRYTRYSKGELQTDATTDEPITTKNIIITFARNYTLNDPENKGRQGLENIGDLDGYYITNGKAIPITCSKDARSLETVYKDANGKEIDVNDGNTFIQICPEDAEVTFE